MSVDSKLNSLVVLVVVFISSSFCGNVNEVLTFTLLEIHKYQYHADT
jgi:hypothetical protein